MSTLLSVAAGLFSIVAGMGQTVPALPDNQWRPQDVAYPWPLPEPEWEVTYYHGNQVLNGAPPGNFPFQWDCHLEETTRKAVCVSSWEIKSGAVCRRDRLFQPQEHPSFFYERYRIMGTTVPANEKAPPPGRVFFWTYYQQGSFWPEWSATPRYGWEFHRLQWIPSGPNCNPTNGCSARARYYINEGAPLRGPFVFDHPTQALNTWPGDAVSPLYPLADSGRCRAWLQFINWCPYNPNRAECLPSSRPSK